AVRGGMVVLVGTMWLSALAGMAAAQSFNTGSTAVTTTGSTATAANSTTAFSAAVATLQTNTTSTITSRFSWNLSADTNPNTALQAGTATHNINFSVTQATAGNNPNGAYKVNITSTRVGALTRVADSAGNGSASITAITGSQTGGTAVGSLNYGAAVTMA